MDIANHTCDIEINRCGEPIGKQDQFSVTFGGFNLFEFNCDDTVCVNPINNADGIRKLEESLLIFYTGQNRVASSILLEQNNNLNESQYKAYVKNIVELVYAFKASLEKSDIKNCGALINESWFYKKKLSENVSNDSIDHAHKVAMANGAYGGKILGAGNGGFIMFLANKSDHKKITKALDFFRPYNFLFDSSGTTVVYNDNKL
jgi:D-glycero-alpha-D-manno-heptose-7-phosphate kinase